MSAQLLDDVKQFLPALEATQEELTTLFGKKRAALTGARSDELLRLAEAEAELAEQMRKHLAQRQRILEQAKQAGLASDSIFSLVVAIGGEDCELLGSRIEQARITSDNIRRESWIHWIISQRALNHYADLLELIAHCGEKAPTYSKEPSEETTGGAIFDASV